MSKDIEMEEFIKGIRAGELDNWSFWICDFRQPDIDKKPIRSVKPTLVMARPNSEQPNKKIYYSESHFRPLSKDGSRMLSKCIPIFDNTGYRSFPGVPLQVFRNENDCINAWKTAVEGVISRMEAKKDTVIDEIQAKIDALMLLQALE